MLDIDEEPRWLLRFEEYVTEGPWWRRLLMPVWLVATLTRTFGILLLFLLAGVAVVGIVLLVQKSDAAALIIPLALAGALVYVWSSRADLERSRDRARAESEALRDENEALRAALENAQAEADKAQIEAEPPASLD